MPAKVNRERYPLINGRPVRGMYASYNYMVSVQDLDPLAGIRCGHTTLYGTTEATVSVKYDCINGSDMTAFVMKVGIDNCPILQYIWTQPVPERTRISGFRKGKVVT